jgi:hypothetical protein
MSSLRTPPSKELPSRLLLIGSVLIIIHFLAIIGVVLSAPSGPWPSPIGPIETAGPKFSEIISNVGTVYLKPLGMTHSYHYSGNQLLISSVYFEALLKDDKGFVVKSLKFPGNSGNLWLAHRYKLIAQGLGEDQQVQTKKGEDIPAPGAKMPKASYWDTSDPKLWHLKTVDENLVPRDRQLMRPSDWSMLHCQAYQRYLLRAYDAASVELIRHSRNLILPETLDSPNPPANTVEDLVCSFGEYRREK